MVDYFVVCAYLILTFIIGIFYARKIKSFQDFAISHRKYNTPVITATLLATVIGGGSTFGVSSKTFEHGLIFLLAFYGFVLNRFVVAKFIVPKLTPFQGKLSVGDIVAAYYGQNGKIITGIFTILVCLGSVGTQCRVVGYVMQYFFGVSLELGVLVASGIFILYAALGGMRAVVITDVFQCGVFLIVLPLIFFVALGKMGGPLAFIQAIPEEKIYPASAAVFFDASNFFFVLLLGSFDPSFIQRILMSRDLKQAATSVRTVGYLSVFILTIMGGVGLCSFILDPHVPEKWNLLYLMNDSLPIFLKGLAVSGLLAALMSTADSDLNCVGIAAVNDLFIPLSRSSFSERRKVFLARVCTILFGCFSACVALYFEDVLSIMKFAFSFWGPTIIVPLIFCLYGKKLPQNQFVTLSFVSILIVLVWNLFLMEKTAVDGFLAGSLPVFLYLFFKNHLIEFPFKKARISSHA